MKMFNKILLLLALFGNLFFVSCEDDNDHALPAGKAEAEFIFYKINTYEVNILSEIFSIKLVIEKDGVLFNLPSMNMIGDDVSISCEKPAILDPGTYRVISYKSFNQQGNVILDVELDKNNEFILEAGKKTVFELPIQIKKIIDQNSIKNILLGILTENFGPDSTAWPDHTPQTWRSDIDILDWENLEYDFDSNTGELIAVKVVHFDEKFKGMTKLPEDISKLVTIDNIVISNLEIEELPESLGNMNLSSLMLINTKLKRLPASIAKSKIMSLAIINSEMTEIQEEICQMEELQMLQLSGNKISSIPEALLTRNKIDAFIMNDTELTALPEDIFEKLYCVSTFNLSDNKKLASFPQKMPQGRCDMQGIFLDGCAYTEIPAALRSYDKLRTLAIGGNGNFKLSASDLKGLPELETLLMDETSFTDFPRLESESLMMLTLSDCGMNKFPDLSLLPNLRKFYFWGNGMTAFPENYFAANPKMVESLLEKPVYPFAKK